MDFLTEIELEEDEKRMLVMRDMLPSSFDSPPRDIMPPSREISLLSTGRPDKVGI